VPGVHVLLAQITITTSAPPAVQQEQQALNALLPGLAGGTVRVVDMTRVELGPDGIHPDDAGYRDMACRWMHGIEVLQ
jgi:lysophospholipase L1-like esterase